MQSYTRPAGGAVSLAGVLFSAITSQLIVKKINKFGNNHLKVEKPHSTALKVVQISHMYVMILES